MTQFYLSMKQKQTHRHREQTVVAKEVEGREGWIESWDQQVQTIMYRMDNQQNLILQYKNLIQYPQINHNGKEYKSNLYVCITESLYYTSGIDMTL